MAVHKDLMYLLGIVDELYEPPELGELGELDELYVRRYVAGEHLGRHIEELHMKLRHLCTLVGSIPSCKLLAVRNGLYD